MGLIRIIAPYLLLASILVPSVSMIAWLMHHRYEIRETIELQLLTSNQEIHKVALTFSHADADRLLEWEHEREFEYQGEMYDVIKQQSSRDSITYLCIWDHAETKIKKQLNLLVMGVLQQDPLHQQQHSTLQQWLSELFFERSGQWKPTFTYVEAQHQTVWLEGSAQHTTATLTPPPEYV